MPDHATQSGDALTERQQEMLAFIRSQVRSRGYPPTFREIAKAMGIHSPNGVLCHIKALVRKGRIEREWNRSRSLKVVGEGDVEDAVLAELLACCRAALESPGAVLLTPALRLRMEAAVTAAAMDQVRGVPGPEGAVERLTEKDHDVFPTDS
jgi:SOS-response transcriptional repressor LexA